MRHNRFLKISITYAILIIMLVGCGNGDKTISITTGGTGGTYYPVGGAIAQMLTDNIEGLTVNSQVGNASVANCGLIRDGMTDSALVQNNVAFWAWSGIGSFEDASVDSLRGVASLYPEAIQIVVLKKSNIRTIEDLVGKDVSVGVGGSGVNFDAMNILDAHDLSMTDINALYLSFSEASAKLKEGEIDAAFVTAGYPTSSIMDVNLVEDIRILPISIEKIDQIVSSSPFYSEHVIPANTYSGIDEDVSTVTTMAIWVISEEVDSESVYQMTKNPLGESCSIRIST